MKALGIDIGGSAVKGAPVDIKTGKLLAERHRIETPEAITPARMGRTIAAIAAHFKWKGPIGVGFPGVVMGTTIHTSANLHPAFVGCDGAKLIAKATRCPVALLNDGAAAAIAEMRFGAGRGFSGKTLLLTLGTGIGTALAYQGVVVPMEFGHLPHKGKSWEKFAAASAREREDLTWKQWARRLDRYIAEMEALFWPELIIVGGGVSAKHEKFFPLLNPRARLVPAEFLNQAGIAGAAIWGAEHA
ncbi:MAG: ROK family protein [Opitutaceae bacterium]|nr:ROK family protein [Opitutaceae bacterium]